MLWSEFYDRYIDWSESTINSKISGLEDVGPGSEVIEVLYELSSEKVKDKLVRKAMRMKSSFSHDDFMELEGEISETVFKELAAYTGFDADNPCFDEDNLMWDDFYCYHGDWSETDLLRRIGKLKNFGPADEVANTVLLMPNDTCKSALCKKAINYGVKFTEEHLWDMNVDSKGNDNTDEHTKIIEDAVDTLYGVNDSSKEYEEPQRYPRKLGFFGGLLIFAGAFAKSRRERRNRGSCNDKPPHYGYRYGRWYYGRGHRHDCQEGGNGRHPQRTSRD